MKNRLLSILTIPNKNVGNLSPAAELELLRQAVRFAEQQISQVSREDEGTPKDGCLREAEAIAKLAQADWRELWEANKRMPGIVHPRELESWQAIVELAELRVAEARAAHLQSALNRMQSHLKEVGEEVRRLRERVETLSRRN